LLEGHLGVRELGWGGTVQPLLHRCSQGGIVRLKHLKYLALLSTFALLSSLGALARENSKPTVSFQDSVEVGSTQLKAGDYKVEWQGTGPAVQVTFLQHGNTVASAPATLQSDKQVTHDDGVVDETNANAKTLKESISRIRKPR
jgi:hypothetical protein